VSSPAPVRRFQGTSGAQVSEVVPAQGPARMRELRNANAAASGLVAAPIDPPAIRGAMDWPITMLQHTPFQSRPIRWLGFMPQPWMRQLNHVMLLPPHTAHRIGLGRRRFSNCRTTFDRSAGLAISFALDSPVQLAVGILAAVDDRSTERCRAA